VNDDPNQNQIILHEDKQYYPDAEEVYKGAETMVQEEDAIPITTPIIAPVKKHDFDAQEKELPQTIFNFEFLGNLSNKPDRIRNLAICGPLHHGKTLLMDMLVQATHLKHWDPAVEHKYTDTRKDEKERGLSIKSMPMSFILQSSREKSYLVNVIDTPGHPNFIDEVACSLRIADGVILVVDVIEGITLHGETIVKHALEEELPIILVVNKLDRLVLELKLPPADAYLKIRRTIEKVNFIIKKYDFKQCMSGQLSPTLGNVIFASSRYSCIFTLKSFAQMHLNITTDKSSVDPEQFARFLWGDIWFNENTRKFAKKPPHSDCERSFIHFILLPFYKLVGYTVSEEKERLSPLLSKMKIYLTKKEFRLDVNPLLKIILSKRFGRLEGLMDAIVNYIPSAKQNNPNKLRLHYNGDYDSELCQKYSKCSTKEPLLINIVKLYHKPDCSSFDAFGRIFSGSLKPGQTVKILDETYNPIREDENMTINEVTSLSIYQSRYKINTNLACAGSWVLLSGIDQAITRTATIVEVESNTPDEEIYSMQPIQFRTEAVMKIACESCIPSEHPKMQEGLRKLSKSYPLAEVKVEESGEHLIIGTGELYLD
jgi:U5 small nuclear ribonucleoprotein component